MDGEQHDPVYDGERDEYLSSFGVLVYRIPNVDFFQMGPTLQFKDGIDECFQLCEKRSGRLRI